MRFSTGLARGAWLLVVLVAISCAEPPHKEMDQAQGAIDAARLGLQSLPARSDIPVNSLIQMGSSQ